MTTDNTQNPTTPATPNSSDDEALIETIQNLLADFRRDIFTSVDARLNSLTSKSEETTKGKSTKDKPSELALKQELDALKSQLMQERLNSRISALASENKANVGLLSAVLKSKGEIIESEGGFYIKTADGNVAALDSFTKSYLATDEGSLLIPKPNTPKTSLGNPSIPSTKFDPYEALTQMFAR